MILGRGGAFALSSPCISLMAIPTATVGIQGEDFSVVALLTDGDVDRIVLLVLETKYAKEQ